MLRHIFAAVFTAVLALTSAPAALGMRSITPEHVEPAQRAEFTLHLQEEVDGAHTTRVEMTIPDGFSLQTAMSDAGWHGRRRGPGRHLDRPR